ncbi:MAG: CoA transferase [Actinobacteria bacterium]|nr:CoA transferase [Actinomycetota bacterium]
MPTNPELPEFGPLAGVKVVHATTSTAGPFAPLLLAEYGADVLWIESTLSPDVMRLGRSANNEAERINQRAIALNIPSPEGREVLLKLLADADVFVESSKGGQYAKWGLSDEVLWGVNPGLIIVHISGFGQTGLTEYVERPSYDPIAQAFSGFMAANTPQHDNPYASGPYIADYVTALFSAIGILAALHRKQRTGEGESIDLSQYEAMLKIQNHLADWMSDHVAQPSAGAPPRNLGWGAYRCADGAYLQLCLIGPGVIPKALTFFGLEYGSVEYPAGTAVLWRGEAAAEKFEQAILSYLETHTASEAEAEMLAAGLPVNRVNTLEDLEHHPHLEARGTLVEWENLRGRTVRSVGPVPRFQRSPGRFWRTSPSWGMDNEDVLQQLGYDESEIAALYEKRVLVKDKSLKFTWPYA